MRGKTPSLVKGMRDFGEDQVIKRNYIFNTIRRICTKYGFAPLETPALEYLETLTGKYGEEGDQLLFKVLNSGNFFTRSEFQNKDLQSLLPQIVEKGLRYDLTVPLIRYIVSNRDQLAFPLRRYQMQPVWRADRPQKGRYREFYQCDADIVGTSSLLCEAEILALIHEVFRQLGLRDFTIHLNHRGVLRGIAALMGATNQEEALCVALDKLDKLGKSRVLEELQHKGFASASLEKLSFIFDLPAEQADRWAILAEQLEPVQAGKTGIQVINQILAYARALKIEESAIELNPTLARGLSYYTGTIFEVKMKHMNWGSIGGGGRYDGLTDVFGLPGISGVGFSFGLDRLYAVLEELDLLPYQVSATNRVMLTNLSPTLEAHSLEMLALLRSYNIQAEIYPEVVKLKKQLRYAHQRNIPWVAIIGEEEQKKQVVVLRDMLSGTQQTYGLEQLVEKLT